MSETSENRATHATHPRNRIVGHRKIRAGDLVPHEGNWRDHPQGQQDALLGVMQEVGFARSLLGYELPDGRVKLIDGHLRQSLLPDMIVDVEILDVTEAEAKLLLATVDPLSAMAESNRESLTTLLSGMTSQSDAVKSLLATLSAGAGAILDVGESVLPDLPVGDREAFRQMTFTLSDSQAEVVKAAMAQAPQTSSENANSNGNALAHIAEAYLAGR